MPDVLDQLSSVIGRKVEPVKQQTGGTPTLDKVLGRSVQPMKLNPFVQTRFNIYNKARQSGLDSERAARVVMTTPTVGPTKPSMWQRAESAFGRTKTGQVVEGNVNQVERGWNRFNQAMQRTSNPLGINDENWEVGKAFIESYMTGAVQDVLHATGLEQRLPGGVQEFTKKAMSTAPKVVIGLGSPLNIALMFSGFGGKALERTAVANGAEWALPAIKTVSVLATLQFAAQMVEGTGDAVIGAVKGAVNGDWGAVGENAISGLASGLMAKGLMDHATAEARVRGDLEKKARDIYGVPGQGVKGAVTSRFDQLTPYEQGNVIDAAVKASPEYSAILKQAEEGQNQAKEQVKKQRQRRLQDYYGQALQQSWEPNAAKRTIQNLDRSRQRRAAMDTEDARKEGIRKVTQTIREAAEARSKAINDEFEARRQVGLEERPERRQAAVQSRTERVKLAEELQTTRDKTFLDRQEAQDQAPEAAQRHVEAVKAEDGGVSYPATYWGEENSFGVQADVMGYSVYRLTPRGVEWLDSEGNFSETPDNLYEATDPETADTLARLSSLTATADSLADADEATPDQKQDAEKLAEIRRGLVTGELSAKDAQKQAGIAEKVTLSDEFGAARDGNLTGPYHESNAGEYLDQMESEARNSGMTDEQVDDLINNAGALARQQTESNLNHVYRPGDYVTSKRGIKWTLDSKGMLHPDDGGPAIPLMKQGFYSNQAMQLAESGRVGYGTQTREERRAAASRRRDVEQSIRENQEQVTQAMRLAVQREGLQLAPAEAPRADVEGKQAVERRRMSRPPRPAESPESQIVRLVFQAPADAKSVINSIARMKETTPDEVMRLALATDPEMSGTTQQKVAGLEVGDRVTEPIRKSPWIVEQRKDGLYLRSGNAQPLKLDRLNPSESVRNLIERGKVEKDIAPDDVERVAFGNPHYIRWQDDQADKVAQKATGEVKEPEPKTPVQAEVQSQAAKRRSEAVESKATVAIIEALDPKTDSVEKAEADVEAAQNTIKLAEEAVAQSIEAQAKTEPQNEFVQKAPVSIGLQGNEGTIVQNQREVPFHYELVPIDALTASHEWRGSEMIPNPGYPEPLQPRTISAGESQQNALRAERGQYDFRQYADKTINGSMGPAIIDAGGQVVGGNTRLAILRKHLQNLDSIPDLEEREAAKLGMKAAMRQLAEDSGIARYPEDGKFYAVVRMLSDPIRDTRHAAELGRLFNKKIGVEIRKSAKGVSYSKSFDDTVLEDIGRRVEAYDGIVPAMQADPDFFRDIVLHRFEVSPEEFADWFEEQPGKGQVLHDEGRNQFVKALLGTVVKDTSVLNRLEGKTPYRALERALGYVVKMRALPDRDISDKIVEAMRASADTMDTDPALSAAKDKWRATYKPDQQQFLGMETESPPEPDRMVEALWRGLHGSDAAVPRVFNDRLKSFIGEETSKGGWLLEAQVETPSEAFNRAFSKELREVAYSRGDNQEGLTQEEYDASLKNRELGDIEREESRHPEEKKEVAEKKPELATVVVSKKMERPPAKATPEEKATETLAETKAAKGFVTSGELKTFLETNPATKDHAPELLRTARLMAEYVYDTDPPVGVDRKEALDWVLKERLAGIETGELKTKRGQYSDPNVEKGFGNKILRLHQASDPSTFIHEFAHVIFPLLSDEDMKAINTIRGERYPGWDGSRKGLKGDVYTGLSEKLAHGLEQFLRDENPTGFTHEVKAVLAKVKDIIRKVYLAFKGDPLSEYHNTEESREVFAKMFGIADFDVADVWRDEVKKARAEEKRMKKPSEEKHPLVQLATDLGGKGIATSMAGKVEDSVGERVDPRKPTAVVKFGTQEEAATAAWGIVGKEGAKIQNAELIQSPEGEWGIRFNTKTKVPPDVLYQEVPEKHPGVELEDLQKRINAVPSYKTMERKLLQLKIDNLKNRIRAQYAAEEEQPMAEAELPKAVRDEVKRGRDSVRTASDAVSGIQKPSRTGGLSKPAVMGMPGYAGARQRGGAARGAVARVPASLSEVTPVTLEPIEKQRAMPVGTVKGEAFDHKQWTDTLRKAGLPENAPPPTYALDPKTAQVLKFPGQKQIVQMAMSALEQGDGFVIASGTGSGKTFTSMGTIKEFKTQNPDALILHITKNRGLLKDAQKVAANSFGFHVETDAPDPGVKSGTFGATYIGLLNDKTYRDIPWDLVIADESGEARNWFKDQNQQGKMLKDVIANSRKAVYVSATPFHHPAEYGYLDKLNLWPKGQFDKWIENNFAHEKIKDKVVARLDPVKQAKLRQQLIERGQLVSQAISYEGFTAHFGVVPVTDAMKRSLDRIREGFARARDQFVKSGKKGMAEKAAAFEATYTKAWLERERIPEAIEVAKKAREQGWQVMIFSETSAEDLFRRPRGEGVDPSTYQELDDAMGGTLSKIIPPFENVYDRLREEFGGDIVDYSGRGNTMASRDAAKQDFLTGKAPMLYTTYAAGGIGVSLHDADYPEMNVKGGDKPRVALFLGPPYSGVLLEQAMGRPWRFGVKSDVHAVFLATDSEPDIRLMQTKVGPRMRALRAAVLGEKDDLAAVMQSYNDEEKVRARQDMLAYAEGDEVKVNAGSYQVRSKTRNVGINDWSQINFPSAQDAVNKGMKYGEDVAGGDWSTLYQSKFGMRAPEPPENERANKIIDAMGNAAVSGKIDELRDVEPAERETMVGLSAATATGEVGIPVDRDKEAVAAQSMEANIRNVKSWPYYGVTLSQELGMENVARRDGKPEVGTKLKLMNRHYRADYDVHRGQYWNMLEDILKQHGLKPKDDVIRELSYVMEGKRTSNNPAITAAAADMSDMMRIAHQDMAKAGVRVTTPQGEKVPYASFEEDPHYFPHRIDWKHEITDPLTGETHTLQELMKDKFDDQIRRRILESIPDLKPYSYTQVLDYLRRNEPRAPILSHIHRTREVNFPFIKRDYQTLVGYFDQVAQATSAAKHFGPEEEKLNDQINKLTGIAAKNTVQSMFRSVLHPQEWGDWSAKIYNTAIAYEAASKMTFSAFKVPFHLGLVPLGMEGRVRPIMRAITKLAVHPKEVMENAAYVGTLSRQLNAADIYYGERVNTPVRQILRKEMFEAAYKMVRAISGESAKQYLTQYALNDLKKGGTRGEHTRRLLRDTFLIGDQGIDDAVKTGNFNQEDLAKAQTAFANLVAFSDDPLQMPKLAREEIAKGEALPSVGLKRAVRLTYALQSFSLKATSLLREKLYDEVVIHKNYKPLAYAIVASPIIGQMLAATGAATKGYIHRGMEGLMHKPHQQDSWDKYLQNLEDTFGHPDAVKLLKFIVDGYTLGYGWDAVRTVVDPFADIAEGNRKKAGQEFQYLVPDLLEHFVGGFFDDLYKTGREADTVGQIEAGQKHPEQKTEKVERSALEYAADQVPAVRIIPWVEEHLEKKKKEPQHHY